MRYQFIRAHATELPVATMCRVLRVSRSGYYDWVDRPASPRRQRQAQLTEQIRAAHAASRQLYGSPRVAAELKARGVRVCQNTVARYMRAAGIAGRARKRFVVRTTDARHEHAVAANALNRRFDADDWPKPNRAWCTDITCIWTGQQGWLYLAAVMDLCSRRIVGWATAEHLRAELCLEALDMALEQRRPAKGLLHHSDRGVQYACTDYQAALERAKIVCSMSRTGNCYDNAAMESFFSTLKREEVYQRTYATHAEARAAIFQYIEVFYNRQRRHSALGYKTPVEFEAALN